MSSDDDDQYDNIPHRASHNFDNDYDEDDVDGQDDEYGQGMGDDDDDNQLGGDDEEGGNTGGKINAWGSKRNKFYKEAEEDVSDDEAEEEEEEEAKLIEELQNKNLAREDFFDMFGEQTISQKEKREIEDEGEEEKTGSSLKTQLRAMQNLAESEKIALIQKESPELLNIIKEYKASLKEVKYKFLPLLSYMKNKGNKEGQKYVEVKFNLLMAYCMNLSFYVLLHNQGKSVKDHPVIKRLISLKGQLAKLKPLDKKLNTEISTILRTIEKEKEIEKANSKKLKLNKARTQPGLGLGEEIAKKQQKNLFGEVGKEKKLTKGKKPEVTQNVVDKTKTNGKTKAEKKAKQDDVKKLAKALVQEEANRQKEVLTKRSREKMLKPKHKAEEEDEELGLHFDDEVDDDDDEEGEYAGIYGVGPNDGSDDDDGENEYYKQVKSLKRIKREKIQQEKQEAVEENFKENPRHYLQEDDVRGINKKILRNKGLTRHRKKQAGNARIMNKLKFQKAMVKQRSRVAPVREKQPDYVGERSIKSGLIRSTKIM